MTIEASRSLPAKSLDFWFDYTCPYAYVASTQARAVAARMGVELTYRPLLLGGVFAAQGTPQNLAGTLGPAKAAHNANDIARAAAKAGVPLTMPAGHPMRSVDALRATLAATRGSQIDPAVVDGFFRAYWVEGRAISDRDIITDVVRAAGHDPDPVLAAIATPAIKDDLKRRTDEAVALGIFGVPTWIVDGAHLYWGQDRVHFVEGVRADVAAAPKPAIAAGASRPKVEIFWDFSSPFAYLATTQMEVFAARTGAEVIWRPVFLGGLFRAIGQADAPIATFSAAKQRHVMQDLDRWAAYWGVPFRFPSRFPAVTIKAIRAWFALPEAERRPYQKKVFQAFWADDQDITDDAVLAACMGETRDLEGARAILAEGGSDAIKAAVRTATEEAVARGVFGVPTFIVDGGDLYWGQDRLAMIEDALASRAARRRG